MDLGAANFCCKFHNCDERIKINFMGRFLSFSFVVLFAFETFAWTDAVAVTNISQGCWANHSLFIKSDGSLWVMGLNSANQLTGDSLNGSSYNTPQEITSSNVTAVASGTGYTLFLKKDKTLWGMGDNLQGSLGLALSNRVYEPVELPLTNVVVIAAGYGHSMFITADGALWGVGNDSSGQLGDGGIYGNGLPYGPRQIELIVSNNVTAVAAGQYHTLFIKSDGSLWGMGLNGYGQLGDGNPSYPQFYPQYTSTNLPVEIVPDNVVAVAAGRVHSLFLKSDGSLWVMGDNHYGQLGDGSYYFTNWPEMIVASNVTAVAAGAYHSLFLKSDGSLWVMGRNLEGQLGDGNFSNEQTALNSTNQPELIVASNVTAIAAGQYHSLFLKSDGSLWCMGSNYYGQLGDGFVDYNSMPIQGIDTPEQIYPPPAPFLNQTIVSATNLQFSAQCAFGGSFYLMASSNISQPMSEWAPVWTNTIFNRKDNIFSATLSGFPILGDSHFFILRSR